MEGRGKTEGQIGRDLFVEVYVEDVLKMIISLHHAKEAINFSSIYNKLEFNLWTRNLRCHYEHMFGNVVDSGGVLLSKRASKSMERRVNSTQGVDAKDRMNSIIEF